MNYVQNHGLQSTPQSSHAERIEQRLDNAAIAQRMRGEISLLELWQLLNKRKSTFFMCFSVCLILAVVLSLLMPVRYEASARLTLDFDSNALQDAMTQVSEGMDASDLKLQTQVKVLETDALSWEVIKRLRLDQRPEVAHRRLGIGPTVCLSAPGSSIDNVSPECKEMMLAEFHRRMRVEALARTQIIELRYRCRSRDLAAQVVNTMSEVYTESSFQTKYNAALRASKWVSGQLDEAKDNAQNAEEKYIAYQKQTGIIGTDENHNVVIERLNAINQQLVAAQANRIVSEARFRVSQEGDPEALVEALPGSTLQVLHSQQAALKNQYVELREKYDDAYPRLKQVKAQLDDATNALNAEIARSKDRLRSAYDASVTSESLLRGEFEKLKQQAYDTNESTVQIALLKRDVDASRELYEQLVKQLNEAGVLAGLRATHVTVIDAARPPVLPVEPHYGINLLFGILAGSLLGLVTCFLQENLDTTIISPQDIANAGSLPALGVVPRLVEGKSHARGAVAGLGSRIAALDSPDGVVADAYRSLRTALLLSNPGAPPKVLLVTSALPGEGKTTTCINMAAVFAQKDQRVLLIDGDMRKSGLNRYLGARRSGGLSAVLAGDDPRQYYVSHGVLPNLMILPGGERPPKPPDLLDSERMRDMVATWKNDFDRVIIDAPPVIGLSDAVILATMSDTVVLVLRAKQSRRQDFNITQEVLARVNVNISGAIINDFQLNNSTPYGYSAKQYGSYFNESGKGN